MAILAQAAAKKLSELTGWTVSNLETQKILYIAHMVSLGRSDGERPLVEQEFQAWDYGPVVPGLYRYLKNFGSEPITNYFAAFSAPADDTWEGQLLAEASKRTRDMKPGQLIAITHAKDGAWAKHYVPGVKGIVIPNRDILDEYRLRVR